jgi:hypothetical protein
MCLGLIVLIVAITFSTCNGDSHKCIRLSTSTTTRPTIVSDEVNIKSQLSSSRLDAIFENPLTLNMRVGFLYDDKLGKAGSLGSERSSMRIKLAGYLQLLTNSNSRAPKVFVQPIIISNSGYNFRSRDYGIVFIISVNSKYDNNIANPIESFKTIKQCNRTCIRVDIKTDKDLAELFDTIGKLFKDQLQFEINSDNMYKGSPLLLIDEDNLYDTNGRLIACESNENQFRAECNTRNLGSWNVIVAVNENGITEYKCSETFRATRTFCYYKLIEDCTKTPCYLTFSGKTKDLTYATMSTKSNPIQINTVPGIIPIVKTTIVFKIFKDRRSLADSVKQDGIIRSVEQDVNSILKFSNTRISIIPSRKFDQNTKLEWITDVSTYGGHYRLGEAYGNVYRNNNITIKLTATPHIPDNSLVITFSHELLHALGVQHTEGGIMSPFFDANAHNIDQGPIYILNKCPTTPFQLEKCKIPSPKEFVYANANPIYNIPGIGKIYEHNNNKYIITDSFAKPVMSKQIGKIHIYKERDGSFANIDPSKFSVYSYNANKQFDLFFEGMLVCFIRDVYTNYTCDYAIPQSHTGYLVMDKYSNYVPGAVIKLNKTIGLPYIDVYAETNEEYTLYYNYKEVVNKNFNTMLFASFHVYRSIIDAINMNPFNTHLYTSDSGTSPTIIAFYTKFPYPDMDSQYCTQVFSIKYYIGDSSRVGYVNGGNMPNGHYLIGEINSPSMTVSCFKGLQLIGPNLIN